MILGVLGPRVDSSNSLMPRLGLELGGVKGQALELGMLSNGIQECSRPRAHEQVTVHSVTLRKRA